MDLYRIDFLAVLNANVEVLWDEMAPVWLKPVQGLAHVEQPLQLWS